MRHSIVNAYEGHDHDAFHRELEKLLADKERLDYLEGLRARLSGRGMAWDAFVIYGDTHTQKSVREQIDDERRPFATDARQGQLHLRP